ncbi:MipA/OmpV family protein [Bordetella petrii]|uniref:MipA/OmpV family protein n=1 Tax=Bordetella petrii TaxID=94624 RepID=UPI001A976808|nr:MipA/OmpV family protein [Bordetella petrii]
MQRGMQCVAALALLGAAAGQGAQAQNFIGAGAAFLPEYDGAKDYRFLPVPLINYENGNFFISPRAGLPATGLKWDLAQDVTAGLFLGMSLGRDDDDADRIKGLGDIDFHGVYGAYMEWHPGRFSLGAAYRQAMRSGYGGTLELRTSYRVLQSSRHIVTVGASTLWASHDDMQTWFGVTRSQAADSEAGLKPYSASAGFKSAALFANWRYSLNKDWAVITTVGVNTLLGDARDSPIVERETSAFGSLGLTYSF